MPESGNHAETLMNGLPLAGTMAPPTIRMRTVRGLGAMAILQVLGAIANLVTLLILARLLTPRDFGIAAVASLVTGVVATFGDFGLGPAVIQRQERVEDALYTAATLRFFIALVLFVVTFLLAASAATLFGLPEAAEPIRIVSLLFLINSAAFIPLTRLQRELKFGVILRGASVSTLASAFTSIGLAYLGFGYWSIVVGSVVAALAHLAAFRLLAPWRPRFVFDRLLAQDLLRYGKHLFLMNGFVFLILNVDNAAIAYSLGAAAIGFYSLAFKWANVPVNFLSKVAAQVMMPAYVLLRDVPDRLRKGYFETLLMVNAVSWPVYVGLFVLADDFVGILLGVTWQPIVVPLRILSVLGILRGMTEPGGYLFLATGRSQIMSRTTAIHALLTAVFVVPGLTFGGISGVALAVVCAYVGNAAIVQHLVMQSLSIRWQDLGRALKGPLWAASGVTVVLLILRFLIPSSALAFACAVVLGSAVYLALLHMLERGMVSRYFRQIIEASRRSTG